jgi:hypothetical protein
LRRLAVGCKRLPDPAAHERAWAFVAEVADDPEAIRDDLERFAYQTRTHGVRVQPEARQAGEAGYAVVDHARWSMPDASCSATERLRT